LPLVSGKGMWVGLKRYPATLALYTLGLGAVFSNRFNFLGHIFATGIPQPNGETETVTQLLPASCMFRGVGSYGQRKMQLLEGMERRHAPFSDWIQTAVRQYTAIITFSDEQHDLMFDKLEIMMALSFAYHEVKPLGRYWAPWGSFVYRSQTRERILREIEGSISTLQHESPYVRGSIFGDTPEECAASIQQFKAFVPRVAQSMGIY